MLNNRGVLIFLEGLGNERSLVVSNVLVIVYRCII